MSAAKKSMSNLIDEAVAIERSRCLKIIELCAKKLEREGSPTVAMLLRETAEKIKED
jgi:hypothetical protein